MTAKLEIRRPLGLNQTPTIPASQPPGVAKGWVILRASQHGEVPRATKAGLIASRLRLLTERMHPAAMDPLDHSLALLLQPRSSGAATDSISSSGEHHASLLPATRWPTQVRAAAL